MIMNTTPQYEYTDDIHVSTPFNDEPQDPAIAAIPENGGYVTVWQTYSDQWGSEIRYQRISPDGTLYGEETVIAQDTAYAAPALIATQDFTAVAYVSATNQLHLSLVSFDDGRVIKDMVVTDSLREGASPAIAQLSEGNFVIGWAGEDGYIHTVEYDMYGKPYAGSEEVVLADVENATSPSITATSGDGAYLVSYGSADGNIYTTLVEPVLVENPSLAQKVYETYSITMPTPIATDNNANIEGQVFSSVAKLADGSIVVTWNAWNESEGAFDIYLRHLDAYGNLQEQVPVERVNTATGINLDPHVAALGDGGYVIVWRANGSDDGDIVARRYDAQGHAVDNGEFTINHGLAGMQTSPAVAAQQAGSGFATIWADGGHDDSSGTEAAGIEASLEVNQIPLFNNSVSETSAVSGGAEVNLNALLTVKDADWAQHLQWSVADEPLNGTLTFSNADAWSGSQTEIAPGGTITYKANAGFVGTDAFTVRVFDGHAYAERTITVNVTEPQGGNTGNTGNVAPGTPVLSGETDSGIKGDAITSANWVEYSGMAGLMDGRPTGNTEVYIDLNHDGWWDGEQEPGAFANNVDGAWTGGFDISSLSDGTYTVYAENNAYGSGAYRSETTLTIDRTAPTIEHMGAYDFDISERGMAFTVTYHDTGSGIDPATVSGDNVEVHNIETGASLRTSVMFIDGNTVTYAAVPEDDGSWDPSDVGAYSFYVKDGSASVRDKAGIPLYAPGGRISDPVHATYTGDDTGNTGNTGNVAPGTPVLSSDSDSGLKDGIVTNADTVTYSGSAGFMVDTKGMNTEVYVDLNGNGWWDGEEEPGTFADNIDGAWSGSIDVSGLKDGTYTVYAENNAFGSGDYKSQTTLTIDRTGPTVLTEQASDFDIRSGSMSFSITYQDSGSGLDPASVSGSNVVVVRNEAPYTELKVEVKSIDGNTVTYTAVPQDGSWGQADAGAYGIYVARGGDGVHDMAGNAMTELPDQDPVVQATYSQAPVLGGLFASNTIDDQHTVKPFAGVTVSDADSDQVSIHIVYEGANGTLSGYGLEGEAGDYTLTAPDVANLQLYLQGLVFTPAPIQAGASQVSTSFMLTPRDSEGAGMGNDFSHVTVKAAEPTSPTQPTEPTTPTTPTQPTEPTTPTTPTTPTEPTTPTQPTQPADPVTHGTVDGVAVDSSTSVGANGTVTNVIDVPVIITTRVDDPATAHATLADIPLGVSGANGVKAGLTVSLPTGAGLHVDSASTLLSNQQALLDLIARIENKTLGGSDVQTRMTGQGGDFLGKLDQSVVLQTATLIPTLDSNAATKTILITGSSVSHADGSGNPSAIGLVIDASQLPSSAVLQLNNVDFAAIVGQATLRGGDGQNYVVGDDAAQNILLGADDDVLAGGGGNDVVGSAGGNDILDGGSGNDTVVGGIGNDSLSGGTGSDVIQGGRSDQGAWNFKVGANGTLAANHELAVFAPGTSENVATSELDLAHAGLSFANVASARLVDVALVYDAVFGRAPDLSGINFWAANPVAIKDIAAYMLQSSEWASSGTGALSDTAFVEKVYTQALGRAADDAGLAFWTGKLAGSAAAPALSRAEVLTSIALSDEHRAHATGADGAVTVGSGTLGTESGWFGKSGDDVLEGGAGSDVLVGGDGKDTVVYSGALDGYKLVLGSAGQVQIEDKANGDLDTISGIEAGSFAGSVADLGFTQASAAQLETLGMLYHAVLHRSADLGGINWWASQNLDQAGLVSGIVNSDEYRAKYASLDDAGFVNALYQAAGLDANAAGGAEAWQSYLSTHTRAELIGAWVSNDAVIDAQQGAHGLWLV
jgi:hypothetical protein